MAVSRRTKLLAAFIRASINVGARRLVGRGRRPATNYKTEAIIELMRRRTLLAEKLGPIETRRHEVPTPVASVIRERLRYEGRPVAGVPCEQITPRECSGDVGVLLYLHGGGYNVCSPATHRGLTSRLALASGARVVVPDYRLAPEHPHPAALEDALGVYRELRREVAAESITIAGDSAGAGLTTATLVALRDAGEALPAAAVLISPWVDLTCLAASIDANARNDYLTRSILEDYATAYVGHLDRSLPAVSPLHADLEGLPPLLIHVGGAEVLHDEGVALAERARQAGVEVELEVWDGAFHVHHALAPFVPDADEAIRRVGTFLRESLEEAEEDEAAVA